MGLIEDDKKKKDPGLQSKEKQELWVELRKAYDLGLTARRPYERKWLLNIAFFFGKQYTFFNVAAHTLQNLELVRGRQRIVDNKILRYVRRQITDLVKSRPTTEVVPNTQQEEDIHAANMGTKALRAWGENRGLATGIRKLATYVYTTGNCFVEEVWNPRVGPLTLEGDVTDEEQKGNLVYEGDADFELWSPFEIVAPATVFGATEIDKMPWVIKAKRMALLRIRELWPEEGWRVTKEDSAMMGQTIDAILSGQKAVDNDDEEALVLERRIKPCPKYPRGKIIIGANKIILFEGDYPFDTYSLEHFKDIEVPGLFWGQATLEHAISIQKLWNRTLSDIAEFNRLMARGKILNPRGSNLEVEPDNTHGEILNYTPVMGLKPEHMTLKGLPQTYALIIEICQRSLDDLFSQHEVSQGTNKSDLRSGVMVDLLLEQDAHGGIISHAIFEESYERFMTRVLRRIQSGYKGERLMSFKCEGGDSEVFHFKGVDLRGNTNVKVTKQSSLPESRAMREAKILERFEKGLYGNPQDSEVIRQVNNMLQDATVENIYGDVIKDEKVARLENENLMQGVQVIANDFDNHQVHVNEHNRARKNIDLQKLKLQDPLAYQEINMIFLDHVMQHQQALEAQMAKMIAQQAALAGKVESGGPGK